MKNFLKENKGFTLIEILVSISIFSVVMLITTSGFIGALRTQRQSSAFTYVNDDLSSVLEQMAREARTGENFCANGTLCPSSSVLSFVNASGMTVTYCLQGDALERVLGSDCASGSEVTSNNVSVQYLKFIISGNQSNSGYPPRVTILVGAKPKDKTSAFFMANLQTTVSARTLNL